MEICDLIHGTEVFHRAEPLAAIHHTISYRELLDRLDPSERWDIGIEPRQWLNRALGLLGR